MANNQSKNKLPNPHGEMAEAFPFALMTRLATAAEMRAMDEHAINHLKLPGRLLMENAAQAVVGKLLAALSPGYQSQEATSGSSISTARIAVCCGTGNNGGDGYAVARLLANRGFSVTVIGLGQPVGDDALANAKAWAHFGATLDWHTQKSEVEVLLQKAVALVDAIFGTGLGRPVEGDAATLIQAFNKAPAPSKIAVDLPSGVDSDTGQVQGVATQCTHTVCLQTGKPGCWQHPGAEQAGEVSIAPISIPPHWPNDQAGCYLTTRQAASALLPPRPPAGHKGTFGHLLALCGSGGMGGAALLAGSAALKSGAGLVTMGVPGILRDTFVKEAPELMTLSPLVAADSHATGAEAGQSAFFSAANLPFYLEEAQTRDALVIGCGLGRNPETAGFVAGILQETQNPLVVDADGLYHLNPDQLKARKAPTVITPHPGEMARLCGWEKSRLAEDRIGAARRFAGEWGVVLVLKGPATVVAAPDGAVCLNTTGDNGLASGGSGDVLTGIIGAFLAGGMPAFQAAVLGVYLHGLARDCQRSSITPAAFTAGNLLSGINPAMRLLASPL